MKKEFTYNCWHGCHKKSEGCLNCYVYRYDERNGLDSTKVYKTKAYDLPIQKKKDGSYKCPLNSFFYLCFSSDFFLEDADEFRPGVLEMIKERKDSMFFCLTKRPERIKECLKDISLYPNLIIYCTMENQKRFDERAPIYLSLPLLHKGIALAPMLSSVDMSAFDLSEVESITCDGESGPNARTLDFEWVKDIRRQCKEKGYPFTFRQTGARILVDNKLYRIKRKDQFSQASKAFKD